MSTQTTVKERPILFSGPMIRAILEGRKTQTRRIKGFDFTRNDAGEWALRDVVDGEALLYVSEYPEEGCTRVKCPYGKVGDRLWVRETWKPFQKRTGLETAVTQQITNNFINGKYKTMDEVLAASESIPTATGTTSVLYAADFGDWAYDADSDLKPWRPSIHIPRKYSRITLETTNIRVERVQDISSQDAEEEGWGGYLDSYIEGDDPNCVGNGPRTWFSKLWNSINEKRGFGWDANPWVWVIEFKRVEVAA